MLRKLLKKAPIIFSSIGILGLLLFVGINIFKPGYLIYIDITEPLDISNLYQRYLYTYSEFKGESLSETPRIALFYLIYLIFQLTQLSDDYFIKIKILVLFIVTIITYITVAKKLLTFIKQHNEHTSWILPSLLGCLFYVTNFWFTNRIMHFGLFFSTVTVPITFYFIYTYLYDHTKNNINKLIYYALLTTIFTATPHSAMFEVFISAILFIVFLFNIKIKTKEKIVKTLSLLGFSIVYMLLNSYWMLPFIVSSEVPDAQFSKTIFQYIGKNSTLINEMGLMGYLLTDLKDYAKINSVQYIFAFIPLVLFIITIVTTKIKERFKPTLLILFLAALFFSIASPITQYVYFYLMFDSPIKNFGWLFREVDKFGLIVSFIYALAITILFYKTKNKKLKTVYLIVYIVLIINNLVFLKNTLNTIYKPQQVPNDFIEVNNILKQDTQLFNTIWYPGVSKPYWSDTKDVEYVFTNQITAKPAITNKSDRINLVEYLFKDENIYTIDMGKTLNLLGVKYLIFRSDENIFKQETYKGILDHRKDLEKVYEGKILTVYKNNEYKNLARIYTSKIITNKGLDIFKDLGSLEEQTFVELSDKGSNTNIPIKNIEIEKEKYIDIIINNFKNKLIYPAKYSHFQETGNSGVWAFGSLENLTHAETDFFFNNAGISIKQLDYRNKVLSSWDGYQIADINKINTNSKIPLSFTRHSNIIFSNNQNLEYKAKEEDFKNIWNIVESDIFNVQNTKAIHISATLKIPEVLEPHVKIQTFTTDNKKVDTKIVYPNERGNLEGIIKIEDIASYAVLQIFTRSTPQNLYTYKINNLTVKDISSNVKNTTLNISSNNTFCTQNCYILARILESELGGILTLNINNKDMSVDTRIPSNEEDRYNWVTLGKVDKLQEILDIKLINTQGFNSINAIAVLEEPEYLRMNSYENYLRNINGTELIQPKEIDTNIYITKINPTKYILKIDKPIQQSAVIAFAMPYNQNWEIKGKPAKIINGYINGWDFETVDQGEYTIEFKPQRYLYTGIVISSITAFMLAIYLSGYYLLNKSLRESNNQG